MYCVIAGDKWNWPDGIAAGARARGNFGSETGRTEMYCCQSPIRIQPRRGRYLQLCRPAEPAATLRQTTCDNSPRLASADVGVIEHGAARALNPIKPAVINDLQALVRHGLLAPCGISQPGRRSCPPASNFGRCSFELPLSACVHEPHLLIGHQVNDSIGPFLRKGCRSPPSAGRLLVVMHFERSRSSATRPLKNAFKAPYDHIEIPLDSHRCYWASTCESALSTLAAHCGSARTATPADIGVFAFAREGPTDVALARRSPNLVRAPSDHPSTIVRATFSSRHAAARVAASTTRQISASAVLLTE